MFEPIKTLDQLVANVREYQKVRAGISSIAKPSGVRDWYFIPAMNMVGACRFISYADMSWDLYDNGPSNVGNTKKYLEDTGWFRQIGRNEPAYHVARSLAASLSPLGKVCKSAKFYVLKEEWDNSVKSILNTPS